MRTRRHRTRAALMTATAVASMIASATGTGPDPDDGPRGRTLSTGIVGVNEPLVPRERIGVVLPGGPADDPDATCGTCFASSAG